MREEFLAIAAHELRTPLAPMKMHLWLLARRLREANAAAIDGRLLTENVAGLERSLARLVNLVDHMVDVSQFERGLAQLRREPTNLSELVCETCEEFVDFMPKGNARLRLDVDPDVRAELDAPRIAMVLRELLANASKFSEGKPIDVRLRRMGDAVELSVHDEGIGISAVDQTRIFGKLERAAEASHYGGLGLGLFLARAIIDAHGGSIRVVSEPGRGATFAVFLPVIDTAIDAIDAESVTD
jgi:signal transduction histidine kinase